jgi:hypothetical protein
MRCPYPAQFAFNSLEGKRDKHWDILVVSARLENKMALCEFFKVCRLAPSPPQPFNKRRRLL